MSREYYCLISGLVEQTLESDHKGFDAVELRDRIIEELSPDDIASAHILYAFYDVENIIANLNGKSAFNLLGNLSQEEIAGSDEPDDESNSEEQPLIKSLRRVIDIYKDPESSEVTEDESQDLSIPIEKALWNCFYSQAERSSCRFIKEWFSFDKTLRNVCAAFTARSKGLEITPQLVGNDEVVDALSKSSAADFGLKNEIEYIEPIISILEMQNIVEKEHRLDLIRWNKAEELTTFDYFNINTILAYMVKVNIIHRWAALDRRRGEQMLKKLIEELSQKEILKKAEEQEN